MCRGALLIVALTRLLVGEVNSDTAVLVKWTDTEDVSVWDTPVLG